MEQIECSETSAYINQTPGNHPKENKQHSITSHSSGTVQFVRILREAAIILPNNMNQLFIVMEKQPDVHKMETEMFVPK